MLGEAKLQKMAGAGGGRVSRGDLGANAGTASTPVVCAGNFTQHPELERQSVTIFL